jgi:hypothetical protein
MTAIYRQDLITYVYCSRATSAMRPTDMPKIIQVAEHRNPNMEITGLLTYGGGMFLQWLEGPHHFVHELMDSIRQDPRHDCVLQLHSFSGVEMRLYPGWSMEHVPAKGIRTVLEQAAEQGHSAKQTEAVTLLLQLLDDGPLQPLLAG